MEKSLAPEWKAEVLAGNLTDADIERLSTMDPDEQRRLFAAGEKPKSPRMNDLEAALRKAVSQLSKAETAASESGMTEAARSLIEAVKASLHEPRGGIVVAHYGRQAEPDGRISKQPIVYINHTNRACPQPSPTMPAPDRPAVPAMAGSGAAGCDGGHPSRDYATDAGDAPLP